MFILPELIIWKQNFILIGFRLHMKIFFFSRDDVDRVRTRTCLTTVTWNVLMWMTLFQKRTDLKPTRVRWYSVACKGRLCHKGWMLKDNCAVGCTRQHSPGHEHFYPRVAFVCGLRQLERWATYNLAKTLTYHLIFEPKTFLRNSSHNREEEGVPALP